MSPEEVLASFLAGAADEALDRLYMRWAIDPRSMRRIVRARILLTSAAGLHPW